MAEYIDRDALKDRVAGFVPLFVDESNKAYLDGLTDAYTLICQAPAADVVERKALPKDVEELVKDLYAFSKDCTDSDMCRDCQLCFMCEDGWPPNAIAHLIETLSATHNAMTERKTGTWIHQSGGESEFDAGDFYICDKCGSEEWNDSNFCPNCGAKMEES